MKINFKNLKNCDFGVNKKNKYNNKETVRNGIVFDSKGEAKRYEYLLDLEASNVIKDLRLQVVYQFYINEKKLCKYIADFTYYYEGNLIVEDYKNLILAKGAVFRLKKKLMKLSYGIDIMVIDPKNVYLHPSELHMI